MHLKHDSLPPDSHWDQHIVAPQMNYFNDYFDLAQMRKETKGCRNTVFWFSETSNHLTEEPKYFKKDSNPFVLLCVSHEAETVFLKLLQTAVTSTTVSPGEQHDSALGRPEPRTSQGPPTEPLYASRRLRRAASSRGCPS